ncbi:MAG TPA: hypothetical protein VH253_03840 [Phycisphaerae bacterium]|nr:hypothetical protein [Phycisphaerae bacterium]
MHRIWSRALAVACFMAMAGLAHAADMVDNPAYQSWAKCKEGTTVTTKSSTETTVQGMADPMKTEATMTMKLVSITPDEVTVETTMSMGGSAMPATQQKIPAKLEKGKENGPMSDQMKDVKEGTDKVTVGGKTYDAKTREYTMEQNGMKSAVKVWTSDDVPGGMVKMESTVTGAANSKTTMELVEVKQP